MALEPALPGEPATFALPAGPKLLAPAVAEPAPALELPLPACPPELPVESEPHEQKNRTETPAEIR